MNREQQPSKSWQECCDEVAKKNNCKDWESFKRIYLITPQVEGFFKEIIELYASSIAAKCNLLHQENGLKFEQIISLMSERDALKAENGKLWKDIHVYESVDEKVKKIRNLKKLNAELIEALSKLIDSRPFEKDFQDGVLEASLLISKTKEEKP